MIFFQKTPQNPTGGGITYNKEDLAFWAQRIRDKAVFYNKGDVKPNSPGLGAQFYEKANALASNMNIDLYTGPTSYKNSSGQSIPLSESDYIRDNSIPASQRLGDRVYVTALMGKILEGWDDGNADRYKQAAKAAIVNQVSQKIVKFPPYQSTWPDNGTRWNPKGHHNWSSPAFEFGQLLKNIFEAFDLIENCYISTTPLFTEDEKKKVLDCLTAWGTYLVDSCNDELDNYVSNRNPDTNPECLNYKVANGQGKESWRLFDGGPFVTVMARHWNNRLGDQFLGGLYVGLRTKNTHLINSFYVWCKEWLMWSVFPFQGDCFAGDMERGNDTMREHSYSYAMITIGQILSGAQTFDEYLRQNPGPYTPLLQFQTSDGHEGSEGGPKTVEKVVRSILKIANQELRLYWAGELLDGYWAGEDWYWTEDTTLAAQMYRTLKDPWLKKSYLREHPGNRPFPADGGNGSGAWPQYSGWGGTEYDLFKNAV